MWTASRKASIRSPATSEPISWGVFPLMGNDALYVRWNGGGGIGDPLDDGRRKKSSPTSTPGLISEQAAGEVYGVVRKERRSTAPRPRRNGPRCGGPAFRRELAP